MDAVGWEEAWHQALYGPEGFYRSVSGPAAHFATATHGRTGSVLAEALVRLAHQHGLTRVVDVGAGRGELLSRLHDIDPTLHLTGVDVVTRPSHLPAQVGWVLSPGGAGLPDRLGRLTSALVVAHEWLDVVPCPVAEVDAEGVLRERQVDRAGAETWGRPLGGESLAWSEAHWPAREPGQRVEVGLTRDRAWAGLVHRIDSGLAVAVDYGHRRGERPYAGTLTAYRSGRQVEPVPDGTCDLTAHVAMDSLDHTELLDQRTVLRGLGVSGTPPPIDLARSDPAGYLRALEQAGAAAALTAPGGFGDFLWAFRTVG